MSGGHLAFYLEHGVSPVRYKSEKINLHIERRESLYRSLGLPPIAFKGAHVIEIAPGSGQNSLFPASCSPASLTLVEPNPAARRDIEAVYSGFQIAHTKPNVVAALFEDFDAQRQFDIVICENWLGGLPREIALIRKLASLVAPGGVMVLTFVPLSGFFPNVMRKLLALRILPPDLDFDAKTAALVDVFGPHLGTMPAMSRSHRDWVQDCMINPHYLNVALPLEAVLGAIGNELEALAAFPRFATDWRWFKSLDGLNRRSNEHLAEAALAHLHNFIDHRRMFPPRNAVENRALNEMFGAIHGAAVAWQAAFEASDISGLSLQTGRIGPLLSDIAARLEPIEAALAAAVSELHAVWLMPRPGPADVRGMVQFGALFGRETVYVSFTRSRAI